MADVVQWFENFMMQLPPLLQLVIGFIAGAGVFKLITWIANLSKKEDPTE